MTPQNIETVFNHIFNNNGRTIGVTTDTTIDKDDTFLIDGTIYIRKETNCCEVKTIKGIRKVDGYIVEKGIVVNNYPDAPDDFDCAPIGNPVRTLTQALSVAIQAYAQMRADHELENIDTPQ